MVKITKEHVILALIFILVLGTRLYFILPEKSHPDYDRLISSIERQGKNTPIQGTSADITKHALVYIYRELEKQNLDAHLIHTVHDEIVVEVREDLTNKVEKIMEEKMIEAGKKILADFGLTE